VNAKHVHSTLIVLRQIFGAPGSGTQDILLKCSVHRLSELKTRDWKKQERIGYGKPTKSKQPTHFQTLI